MTASTSSTSRSSGRCRSPFRRTASTAPCSRLRCRSSRPASGRREAVAVADRWTLRTPTGDLQLNASFHAPKYQPGGVDTNAALRRDGRTTYQRSGDGLPTPGPLVLRGRVWNDARDIAALIDELEAIQEAAATCIEVIRVTDAGRYVYDDLSGGPPPEVTSDGLGGWGGTLEPWPGRALPTFVPPGFTNEWQHYRQSSANGAWSDSITDDLMSVFATTAPHGDAPGNPQMLSWEGLRARKAGV